MKTLVCYCAGCGALHSEDDRAKHRGCRATNTKAVANKAVANKVVPKADASAKPPQRAGRLATEDAASRPNSEAKRVEKWRGANRERYNARQRELMKAKRAAAKEAR